MRKGLAMDGQDKQDYDEIMRVITAEGTAFWNKDYEDWAQYWVHAEYVRIMGWWPTGGVTVTEGWKRISTLMREVMTSNPEPNSTAYTVRRENINLQIRGDVAWLTFDQYGSDTGDARMDMPGLSRETRVLEKQDGEWKIAYVGWLLAG